MKHGEWQLLHRLLTRRADPLVEDNEMIYNLEEAELISLPSLSNGEADWELFWSDTASYVTFLGRSVIFPNATNPIFTT